MTKGWIFDIFGPEINLGVIHVTVKIQFEARYNTTEREFISNEQERSDY